MSETMKDYEAEINASFRKIDAGDIVTGTVIAVTEEEVTVDLRYYAPGIIRAADYSDDPDCILKEAVQVGDTIEATVMRTDDGEGNILLSKKEANNVLAWDVLKGYLEDESVHTVRVKGIVPSGVVAYLEGIRGFIPASQLSLDYVEDCNPFLGKDLDVRVITVDRDKEKLVLSAKTVLRKQQEEARNHRISMLVPGSVVEGTVESLMPYGAFVNLGDGLSGLVHISQICQKRIKHPGEILKEGQKVKAKLLNTNNHKISLSMKALEEEMVDTEAEDAAAAEYSSNEQATTSLGSLLAGIKLS
ncbi:S1 RNA-binding domain-containing protein [Lachnospiraceae bacterium 47-T17]